MRTYLVALVGIAGITASVPAAALTMKECSTKYQAAKAAGTTTKWTDFRKAECGADTAAAPTTAAPAPTPVSTAKPAAPAPAKPMAAAPSPGSYPSAVDPKYSSEIAGKGRMHTCLDAYKAAKASGTLGTTKWIEKGGGYYPACNAHLKV